jgi:hypothetical protein
VLGVAPVGFRAPGYNLSATVVEHLVARGYCYDSSVLPAPLYYSAKAAVMGALALVARPSRSVLGDPRFLVAPGTPYRPDASAPWRRGQAPIIELPITVTPRLHVPVIGTYVVAAPRLVREHLVSTVLERPFFNFELHGIDLVDAEADEIPAALVAKQPDLRVPLDHKLAALEHALDRLAERFRFLTLADYAASFPG